MNVETQRQLLEELDCLEAAAAQRFRRNPELGRLAHLQTNPILDTRKRPYKESLLQQHELCYFGGLYEKTRTRVLANVDSVRAQIEAQRDPRIKLDCVLGALKQVEAKYRSHSSSSVGTASASSRVDEYALYLSAPLEDTKQGPPKRYKRKHFLSRETAHLRPQLADAFGEHELYGKVLDLTAYYEMYKLIVPTHAPYVEYLASFSNFSSKLTSPDYARYLEALLLYLVRMHRLCMPLLPLPNWREPASQDGEPNEKGEVFCKACGKLFAKHSVYSAHLSGKKHQKNLKAAAATEKSTEEPARKPGIHELESRIQQMAHVMQPIIHTSIAHYERCANLSDREKMLDALAVEGEESDFTTAETASEAEDEDDDDELYSKELPIGTDGTPIPLWLYKLQGLHRTYNCEICGNAKYKGRQQFSKHFGQAKHVHGLMCLGIAEDETPLFESIHTILEAQDLWNKLKRAKRNEEEEAENQEIEDDDGNVMSHKDYMELKKQGLI